MSGFILTRRFAGVVRHSLTSPSIRTFASSTKMSTTLNSETISKITEKEKELTGKEGPVKGGPTAQAQRHVGEEISSSTISAITRGEQKVTGESGTAPNGPAALAQSMATNSNSQSNTSAQNETHTGTLDASTISKITEAEKTITGQDGPIKSGPSAEAMKHSGEPITSEALHDITEGEKKVTGGERVKGGPTATAQSALSRSRTGGD